MEFEGKSEEISRGSNPGEFDAKSYYRTKGIYIKMSVTDYRVVDKSCDNIGEFFFSLRKYLNAKFATGVRQDSLGVAGMAVAAMSRFRL